MVKKRTDRQLAVVAVLAFAVTAASDTACAEHRVALLIAVDRCDDPSLKRESGQLSPIAKALEKRGFRCTIVENLDEQALKRAIEGFADTTPTLGTSLVYFSGHALPGSYKGTSGVCLLGTNSKPGRGYLLKDALLQLNSKGGSELNIVVIDTPEPPAQKVSLPPGSLLAYSGASDFVSQLVGAGDIAAALKTRSKVAQSSFEEDATVSGSGSVAVASPDDFAFGKNAGDEWVNSRGTVFCWCPPGRYVKGSPTNEPGRYSDEEQTEVTITDGFWIAKYEMTLRENPRGGRPYRTIAMHKNDPLTMVNYDDARNMTQRTLTEIGRKAERLPADWQYSLTTEEQWEYAARAGTTTAWHFGTDVQRLPQYANFADTSWYDTGDIYSNYAHRTLNDGAIRLARVGSYRPNPWGLRDMHGNVAEWCAGTAIRGGSWVSTPESCRSAYRHSFSSRDEQNFIGYRIVIQKTPPAPKKNDQKN